MLKKLYPRLASRISKAVVDAVLPLVSNAPRRRSDDLSMPNLVDPHGVVWEPTLAGLYSPATPPMTSSVSEPDPSSTAWLPTTDAIQAAMRHARYRGQ